MNGIELKETLMDSARRVGICAPGYELMRGYDRTGLVDYYIQNPDWCIERGFPSLDLLRSEFLDVKDKGVYVGETFNGETFDKLQSYIFHDCKGTIRVAMDYDNEVIPMLYFANGCDMRVECIQRNTPAINVPLYISEDCKVISSESDGCIFRRNVIKAIKQ